MPYVCTVVIVFIHARVDITFRGVTEVNYYAALVRVGLRAGHEWACATPIRERGMLKRTSHDFELNLLLYICLDVRNKLLA